MMDETRPLPASNEAPALPNTTRRPTRADCADAWHFNPDDRCCPACGQAPPAKESAE